VAGPEMGTQMTLNASEVRIWAKRAQIPTADRGRIPRDIVAAYLKAHPALTRELAGELGIQIPARGPVSIAACDQVAMNL